MIKCFVTQYLYNGKHRIAFCENIVENAQYGIVVIHGLAEHKGRYNDFIKQLTENGISVFAADLRGHGESGGHRGDAKTFKQFLNDLDLFIRHIKNKHPSLSLVLFGHSFGGQVCLVLSALNESIDGLILSNPLLSKPLKSNLFKIIPYKLLGFIKLKKKHSESQEMLEVSKNDPLSCHTFSLRLVGIMFDEGIKLVNKNISKVNCPVLMIAGKLDPLINVQSTETVFEKLVSNNKTLKIYDNVKHRIVQNEGCVERIEEIIDWVKTI